MTVKELIFVFVLADDVVVSDEVSVRNIPIFCRWSAMSDQLLIRFRESGVDGGGFCVS